MTFLFGHSKGQKENLREEITRSNQIIKAAVEWFGEENWYAALRTKHYVGKWQDATLSQNVEVLAYELQRRTETILQYHNDYSRLSKQAEEIRKELAEEKRKYSDAQTRWSDRERNKEEKYAEDLRSLNERNNSALETARREHELHVRNMSSEHELEQQKWSTSVSQLHEKARQDQRQWKEEKSNLERQHREQQERWKEAQNELKKEIRSRNNALVKRETFNHLSDGELTAMFGGLINEINALARLKWTRNGSPWTDELQKRMSDTPKRLQRQILQDTIWTSLYENIFFSPFRMLGDEGSHLEVQWSKDFGKNNSTGDSNYTWPNPTFASERWRFEVMRKCQEALNQPISEYDSREKLFNGYKQSLSRVRKDISKTLELVLSLDEATSRSIDHLTEKASRMWAAFGAQRCRLMVVMTGLKSTIETPKQEKRSDRSVELIMTPGLRRIGDAEGELFEGETIITGCEGESVKITY